MCVLFSIYIFIKRQFCFVFCIHLTTADKTITTTTATRFNRAAPPRTPLPKNIFSVYVVNSLNSLNFI